MGGADLLGNCFLVSQSAQLADLVNSGKGWENRGRGGKKDCDI